MQECCESEPLWSLCGMCFAASIWPDRNEAIQDDCVCRNCRRRGTLCACIECQKTIALLDRGVDVEQDLMDGSCRWQIYAKEWNRFFGAKKIVKLAEG